MTCQQAFDIAIALIDEKSSDGTTSNDADIIDYKTKAIDLINICLFELCSHYINIGLTLPEIKTDLIEELEVNNIGAAAISYYLAAKFMLADSNTSAAAYFEDKYNELKYAFKNTPIGEMVIEDVYGGFEG